MGKRCDCGFVMAAFEGDPRLMALPLAVRALWLVLVRKMQALGEVALVFGSVVPDTKEVSLLVSIAETELETHLEPLLARGLLVRRADGALACPLLEGRRSRSDAARINGLKGGRPRKNGSPARQRNLILPMVGGVAGEAAEKPEEPLVSPAKLSSLPEEKAQAEAVAVTPELVQRVGFAAAEAAGLDPARGGWTIGVVRRWLEAGADEGLILDVIRQVMARPNPPSPQGLGYFGRAVEEALALRRARPVAVAGPVVTWAEDAAAYNARVDAWERNGRFGPPPVRRQAEAA